MNPLGRIRRLIVYLRTEPGMPYAEFPFGPSKRRDVIE